MALTVALEMEPVVHVGDELEVTVVVHSPSRRAIGGVDVRVAGSAWIGAGDDGPVEILSIERALSGPTDLLPGTRRFRGRIPLGATSPSHGGGRLSVAYGVTARVQVPWWFDAVARAPLRVALPERGRPAPSPARAASTPGAGQLSAELSVDDVHVAPGDVVSGAFSLGNTRGHRLDGAAIGLEVELAMGDRSSRDTLETSFRSITLARDGGVFGFSLRAPETAAPTCERGRVRVAWNLVLRIDGSTLEVRLPVQVGPYARRTAAATSVNPTAVGSARWRQLWEEVGSRHGLALAAKKLRLEGAVTEGIVAQIEPGGAGLAAELRWESWGIELDVAPKQLFRRGNLQGLSEDTLFRRFAISGRCEEQVVDALSPDLVRALEPFADVELHDAGARLGAPGAPHDPEAVERFVAAVVAVARCAAAAEPRIGPPPAAGPCAPAWRRLAETTWGRLRLGRLAVLGGRFDGEPFDLETVFDGELPVQTRVALQLHPPLPAQAKRAGRDRGLVAPVVDAARTLRLAHAEGTPQAPGEPLVLVARRQIALEVAGFLPDPGTIGAVLSPMLMLARTLRGERGAGPYR